MPRYTAQEDGSITYADADDITVVEPILTTVQTAGGYTRHEPDHETACLMAAAPELLEALQETLEAFVGAKITSHPRLFEGPQTARQLVEKLPGVIRARAAIHRATNPAYKQNAIGQLLYTEPIVTPENYKLQAGDHVSYDAGKTWIEVSDNPSE